MFYEFLSDFPIHQQGMYFALGLFIVLADSYRLDSFQLSHAGTGTGLGSGSGRFP